MCLSVFLVVRSPETPAKVLLGKIDPSADWWELAALGPDRVARLTDFWMLPASQLLLLESPDDAARRVAREQLGWELEAFPPARVFSQTSARAPGDGKDPHWDVMIVYEVSWPPGRPLRPRPWRELDFLPVSETSRSGFGRGHGDVLELARVPPRD